MIGFAVLWIISPLILIPMVIVLYQKNIKMRDMLKELEKGKEGLCFHEAGDTAMPKPKGQMQSNSELSQKQSDTRAKAVDIQYQPQMISSQAVKPQETVIKKAANQNTKINAITIVFFIGVLFVVIAGLIFATTTWQVLPDLVKVVVIFFLIIVFFVASYFARSKLHLVQTGLTFYSLGSLFIPLSFLGMGYFRMLGNYFAVGGKGAYLLGFTAFFLLTFTFIFGAGSFKSKLFVWLAYTSGTIALLFMVWQITSESDIRGLLCALYCMIMVMLMILFSSERKISVFPWLKCSDFISSFSRYTYIVFYSFGIVLIFFSIMEGIVENKDLWIVTLLCILFALTWLIIKGNQKWIIFFHPFISAIIVIGIAGLEIVSENKGLVGAGLSFIVFLIYYFICDNSRFRLRTIVSDLLFIPVCWLAGGGWKGDISSLVVAILCLMMFIVLAVGRKENTISRIACHIVPWSSLYVLYCVKDVIARPIGWQLLLLFFIFSMLFTLLGILHSKNVFVTKRLIQPFSVMLWIVGIVAAFMDFFFIKNGYHPIYLWMLALYATAQLFQCIQTSHIERIKAEGEKTVYTERLRSSQLWLYLSGFGIALSMSATLYEVLPDVLRVIRLSVPMLVIVIVLLAFLISSKMQKVTGCLKNTVWHLLMIMLYAYLVIIILLWRVDSLLPVGIGIMLFIINLICYWSLHRWKNTIAGFVSVFLFYSIADRLLKDTTFSDNLQYIVWEIVFMLLLFLSRCIYPQVCHYIKKENNVRSGYLLDWIGIGILGIPCIMLISNNRIWEFIAIFLLIGFVLNFLGRSNPKANKFIYTVVMILLCVAWWWQPFMKIPDLYRAEINMLPLLLSAFCFYRVIWKEERTSTVWGFYITVGGCALWQFCEIVFAKQEPFDIRALILGTLLLTVAAGIKKNKPLIVLSIGTLLASLIASDAAYNYCAFNTAVILNYLLVLFIAAICYWTMYRIKNTVFGCIPVMVVLVLVYKLTCILEFNKNVVAVTWLLVYVAMLVLSRFLHHRVFEISTETADNVPANKTVGVDWHVMLSIIPTFILLMQQQEGWQFCGMIMAAVYCIALYKRIHKHIDQLLLTVAAILFCIAWLTQPFIQVPELYLSEWYMMPLVLLAFTLYKWIWKNHESVMSWVFCLTVAICLLWQGIDAILSKELFDVIVLGLLSLFILLVSFWKKRKRWFLLSGIILIMLAVYLSREFWLSIAWWIYLLATGVILIILASFNEYYKKKGEKSNSKIKRLMQEWTW